MDDTSASCLLYAGLTAWSALFVSGQLGGAAGATTSLGGGSGKRVLVLGGSGGVGNIAIQILQAENAQVVTTCSTDAVASLEAQGVNHVIDYKSPDALQQITSNGP